MMAPVSFSDKLSRPEPWMWLMKGSLMVGIGILLGALLGLATTAEARTAPRVEVKQIIIEEASRTNVPVDLVLAVAKVESDFDPGALSSAGARGVMQIMPRTAKAEFGLHPDRLWDARTNVRTGVKFLSQLHNQYGGSWERALSHYNGGTLKNNRPHGYTQGYVRSVMKWRRIYGEQAAIWNVMNRQTKIAKVAVPPPSYAAPQEEEIPVPDVDIFAEDEDDQDVSYAELDVEEWQPSSRTVVLQEEWTERDIPQVVEQEEIEIVQYTRPIGRYEEPTYEWRPASRQLRTLPHRRPPPMRGRF